MSETAAVVSLGTLPDNGLPIPTVHVTTNRDSDRKAVYHASNPVPYQSFGGDSVRMGVAWSTSQFPENLIDNQDISAHQEYISGGPGSMVNANGSLLRFVDFSPGGRPLMHRTLSVDYGVVLEGEVYNVLDSGEEHLLKRGDAIVQRATRHAWRNASETQWARVVFVLQPCQPLVVGGKELDEDLGHSAGMVPPSGNALVNRQKKSEPRI